MWIPSQLLLLAGQTTTIIIPVFSGPVVCAFPELFPPTSILSVTNALQCQIKW